MWNYLYKTKCYRTKIKRLKYRARVSKDDIESLGQDARNAGRVAQRGNLMEAWLYKQALNSKFLSIHILGMIL